MPTTLRFCGRLRRFGGQLGAWISYNALWSCDPCRCVDLGHSSSMIASVAWQILGPAADRVVDAPWRTESEPDIASLLVLGTRTRREIRQAAFKRLERTFVRAFVAQATNKACDVARLTLAQHGNEPILGKSAPPDHAVRSDELTYRGHDFRGAGQPPFTVYGFVPLIVA